MSAGASAGWLAAISPEAAAASAGGLADHWVAVLVIGLLVALAVFLGAILTKYLRLGINMFLDTPLPVTANLPDYAPPEGEIVSFPSLDGRSLRGLFIDRLPGAPDRGTVIFCHEFASDLFSAGRYARPLVEAGYTVFTFDFRGHGRSFTPPHFEPRHWPSNYEVHDVLAAIAYVESRRDVAQTGVGLLGVSRGACAATMAAVLTSAVRCLVVDGVFSTDYRIDQLMKRWVEIYSHVNIVSVDRSYLVYRFFRVLIMFYVELKCRCRFPSTRKALAKLETVPVLFISGERDTYVPPDETLAFYDMKPGPKEVWICPGAKHNQAVATDPRTYAEKITAFFDRHLRASGQEPASRQVAG
jgi:pimeloyl-ACP methyl ester carboxylesterase